jgi:hypothetical protein
MSYNFPGDKFRPRPIYVILAPHSLPYARYGLQTLLLNSLDALDIILITDSTPDRETLLRAVDGWNNPQHHRIRIMVEAELADAEASVFLRQPNLRSFRHGHPCWRKITDPLLIADAREEIIILDPDLYFPNHFCFEPTPPRGVLLMWQKPNCLLPQEVVRRAIDSGILLARHVDIGVAHWRFPGDLEWLDWLLGRLGGPALPQAMHVEAIVWAAIAMRDGGGYLDTRYWKCWERTPAKRIMRKLGLSGKQILQSEPWSDIKCFHAGGEAKRWLAEMEKHRRPDVRANLNEPGIVRPFVELTPERYKREEARKRLVRNLDFFHIVR